MSNTVTSNNQNTE